MRHEVLACIVFSIVLESTRARFLDSAKTKVLSCFQPKEQKDATTSDPKHKKQEDGPFMTTPLYFGKGTEFVSTRTPIYEHSLGSRELSADKLINIGLLEPPEPNSGFDFIQLPPK